MSPHSRVLLAARAPYRTSGELCVCVFSKLEVMQVNTSGEESKSGIPPESAPALAKQIHSSCPHLSLVGVMTIGTPSPTERSNDFETLAACRAAVAAACGVDSDALELSMGMSGDFEEAIVMGSSSVRVGSAIFGARDYSKA